MKMDRVRNYPRALAGAFKTSLALSMPPSDVVRYLFAYTKNARSQLGSPEKFHLEKTMSFRTRMGVVHIRDGPCYPAAISELLENHYEFSKSDSLGAYVDVGAGTGLAAMVFLSKNPNRKSFCFEPVDENAGLIEFNLPGAKVYRYAIGRKKGTMEFYVDQKNYMAFKDLGSIKSILKEDDPSTPKKVSVFPLDYFEKEIGDVAMLKIDTEGSEVDVLLGAKKTLLRTAEVRLETHSPSLHSESRKILTQNGFRISKDFTKGSCGYLFARK